MALRTVFIQFQTNVNAFSAQMKNAQTASNGLEQATRKRVRSLELERDAILRVTAAQGRLTAAQQAEQDAALLAHRFSGMRMQDHLDINGTLVSRRTAERELADAVRQREAQEGHLAIQERNLANAQYKVTKATDDEADAHTRARTAHAARLAAIGRGLGLLGIGIIGSLGAASLAAGHFESDMEQVAVVAGTTLDSIDSIGLGILSLGQRAPVPIKGLVEGMVAIQREGYRGADSMGILTQAARAATVGLGSVEGVATTLVTVMKAYGFGVKDAATVTNVLVRAFQLGQGSMEEMSQALIKTGPIAAGLRIPINEVAAALTASTRSGISAGNAAQALNRILTQSLKPNQELYKEIVNLKDAQHQSGFASSAEAFEALGLQGVLQGLIKAHGGNTEAIFRLNPSIRSAGVFFALMANNGKDVNAMFGEFTDESKLARAAQEAFNKEIETFEDQVQITKNSVHAASVELGRAFLPTTRGIVEAIGGMAGAFADASPDTQKMLGLMAGGIGTIGIFAGALGLLAPIAAGFSVSLGAVALVLAPLIALLAVAGFGLATAFRHAQQGRMAVASYADAWQAAQGKIGPSVQALVEQNLAQSKAITTLNDYGLSLRTVENAILGGHRSIAARAEVEQKFSAALDLTDKSLKKRGFTAKQITQIHDDLHFAVQGNKEAYDRLNATLGGTANQASGWKAVIGEMGHAFGSTAIAQGNLTDKQKEALETLRLVYLETTRAQQGQDEYRKKINTWNSAQGTSNQLLITTGEIIGDTKEEMERLSAENQQLVNTFQGFVGIDAILENIKKKMEGFADPTSIFKDLVKSGREEAVEGIRDSYAEAKAERDKHVQELKDRAKELSKSVFSPEYKHAAKEAAAAAKAAREQDRKEQREEIEAAKKIVPDVGAYVNALKKTAEETKAWNANLSKISKAGFTELAEHLRNLGEEGVPLVAKFAQGTKEQMQAAEDAISGLGPKTKISLQEFEDAMREQAAKENEFANAIFTLQGAGYDALARQFLAGGVKTAEIASEAAKKVGSQGGKDVLDRLNTEASKVLDITSSEGLQRFRNQFADITKVMADQGVESVREFIEKANDPETGKKILENIANSFESAGAKKEAQRIRDAILAAATPPPQQGGVSWWGGSWGGGAPTSDRTGSWGSWGGWSQGGIVNFYGEGAHVAQVAPAGSMRVWAEPETGGEAYIPLAPSKRGRSIDILGSVASHFGYGLVQNASGNYLPAGSTMLSSAAQRAAEAVIQIIQVPVPESKVTEVNFNGDIKGLRLEEVIAKAERIARRANATRVGASY